MPRVAIQTDLAKLPAPVNTTRLFVKHPSIIAAMQNTIKDHSQPKQKNN